MPFLRPISDRYFEDYIEGDVHCFGTIAVEADEIVAFANRFDPQTLHTDPEAAKSGPFGGVIASGWHTAGLMTRLFVDHYLTKVASLGSLGGDELRWVKPVRPGDTLSVRVTVLKAVPSKARSRRDHLVRRGNQSERRSSDDVQGRQHHRQALAGELKAGNVRLWHKADVSPLSSNVRFWG